MGSSSENILKQSFGGVYSNELLAEGGQLYSERPEPFSYISVEVHNCKEVGTWDSAVVKLPVAFGCCLKALTIPVHKRRLVQWLGVRRGGVQSTRTE